MDLLLAETYDKVYQRHQDMANYTQNWAKKHFSMFPEPGYESITVSCINSNGKDVKGLNQKLSRKRLHDLWRLRQISRQNLPHRPHGRMEPSRNQRRNRSNRLYLGIVVTIKILVSDKIADEGIKTLQEEGYQVTRGWDIPKPDLPKIIGEYDVLIVRSATKVKGELLDNAKKLKVIGRAGEGLDNVDYERAKQMGITLVNTPHVSYISVSELTIGHMVALARNIVQSTLTLA